MYRLSSEMLDPTTVYHDYSQQLLTSLVCARMLDFNPLYCGINYRLKRNNIVIRGLQLQIELCEFF